MENFPLETAKQRAARIWRNNALLKKVQSLTQSSPEQPQREDRSDQLQARFRKEMRSIMTERSNKTLLHYLIALRERKRRQQSKPDE
jgi:hypothetical protein